MTVGDRRALVTGSTQGLGEAFARALFERGDRVMITGRRAERAEEVARSLDPSGERAIGLGLDVRERTSFARVVDAAVERWGGLDILVNNAGATVARSVWDITDDEWDEVLETNLRSVFVGCQLLGPLMRDNGWGRIVNHASIAGQQGGLVAGAHYAASKAGIVALTKSFARALASDGVTVNAIAPAAIAGPAMDSMPPEKVRDLPKAIPVGRVGRPEEVAALVAFLASEDAGYITGSTYDINGGVGMR